MQAIKSTSQLVGTARTAVGVRSFANASSASNPASKDMSKANWAGDKINDSIEEKNPFKQEDDLHARGLDEQTRDAILKNIFPRNDNSMKNASIDWSKNEKKNFTDPAHSALDRIAEKVESRGAKASEKFKAPKDLTEGAANFATGADRAAHAFDGVRASGAAMSSVGSRIADMAHAPSIGTKTASMRGEYAQDQSASSGMMESVKEGMANLTEKMSDMGASISEKMKPMGESLGEKIHVPTEMPLSIKNARDTIKNTAESIKDSLPKSMDEAKDMVKNVMPSMEGAKNMAESAKEKVESAMPSSGSMSSSAKSAMQSAQEKWNDAKDVAKDKFEDVKESMPSKFQMKGMAAEASDKMSQAKDFVAEKASDAKETMSEAASNVNASGVVEQFKQGMATVKEAMKPIVDYSTEKIKEGAAIAAEKIPPMAQSVKESIKSGASAVMHSSTMESVKENLSASANKAYEKAKDSASSMMTGKSEGSKMDIKEETATVSRGGMKADSIKNLKDQEMSSSDIYKP